LYRNLCCGKQTHHGHLYKHNLTQRMMTVKSVPHIYGILLVLKYVAYLYLIKNTCVIRVPHNKINIMCTHFDDARNTVVMAFEILVLKLCIQNSAHFPRRPTSKHNSQCTRCTLIHQRTMQYIACTICTTELTGYRLNSPTN